ncbi:MAG: ribosomal RNA small subunit methyltransferase A [Ignavibacteriae bacterium]|nr:ribosomal RNA small subunit methyltransferase A [Ignavibacteriota bacterium]
MSKRLYVKPKQSLGQNFLVDDNIARKITASINPQPEDVLVEIGPGQGALTKQLVKEPCRLIAYEVDGRVVESLRQQFESEQVSIIHQDFLQADLQELSSQFKQKLRVVGNIPYHLTSEIFFKTVEARRAVSDLTMMIQKEVAQRFVAKPGTKAYGILSVVCQFYGKAKSLFTVSPNCFYPKPKVTSTVIQFSLFDTLPYRVNESLFRTVVKTAFGKRRKTLRNSLKYLPFEETKVVRILARIPLEHNIRAEQLSPEQFVELTNQIEQALQE